MQITTETSHLGHKITKINAVINGPSLLVFGGIHGNEPCGEQAIIQLVKKFQNKDIFIEKGSIIFIQNCNVQACKEDKRYIDINLNRIFKKHQNLQLLEEKYANFLVDFVEQTDYFLDLHSTTQNSVPFVFDDVGTKESRKLSEQLNLPYIVQGWPNLYEANNDSDTLVYASSRNVTGVLVECGQHSDSQSVKVAKSSIIQAMRTIGLNSHSKVTKPSPSKVIKMYDVIYKSHHHAEYTKQWKSFDFVSKSTAIAFERDGKKIYPTKNSTIIMPNPHANIGEEWLYLGEEVD